MFPRTSMDKLFDEMDEMINQTLADRAAPPKSVLKRYEFIAENQSDYFEQVYKAYQHPFSMLVAVECLLLNPKTCSLDAFNALTRGGFDGANGYQTEAREFYEKVTTGALRFPQWKLERNIILRWVHERNQNYTFHELFWLAFLGRWAGISGTRLEHYIDTHIERGVKDLTTTNRELDIPLDTVRKVRTSVVELLKR